MAITKGTINNALTSIRDKLVADTVFTADECWLGLEPELIEYGPGGIYCIITPRQNRIQPGVGGGGTEVSITQMDVQVTIWSHYAADEAARDSEAITNSTLGLYQKVEDVIDSLQIFMDCDGTNGNFAIPMRMESIDAPKRSKEHPTWCYISMNWKVQIWLDI